MTALTASLGCARWSSRCISRRNFGIPPSTAEPPRTQARPNRSGAGRRSRSPWAGQRPSAAGHRSCIVASSMGTLHAENRCLQSGEAAENACGLKREAAAGTAHHDSVPTSIRADGTRSSQRSFAKPIKSAATGLDVSSVSSTPQKIIWTAPFQSLHAFMVGELAQCAAH